MLKFVPRVLLVGPLRTDTAYASTIESPNAALRRNYSISYCSRISRRTRRAHARLWPLLQSRHAIAAPLQEPELRIRFIDVVPSAAAAEPDGVVNLFVEDPSPFPKKAPVVG